MENKTFKSGSVRTAPDFCPVEYNSCPFTAYSSEYGSDSAGRLSGFQSALSYTSNAFASWGSVSSSVKRNGEDLCQRGMVGIEMGCVCGPCSSSWPRVRSVRWHCWCLSS